MSSQQTQAIIQAISDSIAAKYALVATITLLVFDTLLTLPSESMYIWCRKVRLGTVLYILTRYATLVVFTLELYVSFFEGPLQTCNTLLRLSEGLVPLVAIGIDGLLLSRAYAISGRSRTILVALSILLLGNLIIILLLAINGSCRPTRSQQKKVTLFATLSGVDTILFESIVVAVTIQNIISIFAFQKKSAAWQKQSFSSLLVQHGLLRYGFVLSVTLTLTIVDKTVRASLLGIMGPIQNGLSAIIVCHFHLILQKRNHHLGGSSYTSSQGRITTWRAAAHGLHNAVLDEFGDVQYIRSHGLGASHEDIEDPNTTADIGIMLQEYPVATGDVEQIASGSGTAPQP